MSLRRILNVFYALLVDGEDQAGRGKIDAALRAPLEAEALTDEERAAAEHREHVKANAPGLQALQQMFKTTRPA